MEVLNLEKIAALCGGRLGRGNPKALALRITTDSRDTRAGDCFIALQGERRDGHTYLAAVAGASAVAAIVSRRNDKPATNGMARIEVDDTLRALQRLASGYRNSLQMKVVAVTGSNGKTTTKEMCASVLARRFAVAKTSGNFNNHIGVPLSLLGIRAADEVGIFEIGTNHPGEIAALAALVRPDVAVVTNVGLAHVGFFGSVAAVAEEKGALVESLGRNGVAILNADDEWSQGISKRCKGRVATVGITQAADIRAKQIEVGEDLRFVLCVRKSKQEAPVTLRLLGRHQIYNALNAAAVGIECGMELEEIVAGLESASLPAMRMQREHVGGVEIFNDAYNANPDSMEAALTAFGSVRCRGRKIAVLGDMMELGGHSTAAHERIGEIVAGARQIKRLVTVGPQARTIGASARSSGLDASAVRAFDSAETAAMFLKREARAGDGVLLKGSRAVGLERIVEVLREREDIFKPNKNAGKPKETALARV